MSINELTISEAKAKLLDAKQTVAELSELFGPPVEAQEVAKAVCPKVIIRARDAGVHFGTLQSVDGRSVVLTDSRRMWRWWSGGGEHTLSGVARHGLADRKEVKIAGPVATISILDACEIIGMTDVAIASLESAKVAQAS
jgi:hypothetical protein